MSEEHERLSSENVILRGLVATIVRPCHYCGAETMAKCPSGFPGCALADDLLISDDELMHGATGRLRSRAVIAETALRTIAVRHPDATTGQHPAVDIARAALATIARSATPTRSVSK